MILSKSFIIFIVLLMALPTLLSYRSYREFRSTINKKYLTFFSSLYTLLSVTGIMYINLINQLC